MKRIVLIHHTGELCGGTKSLIDMANMLSEKFEVVICVPKGKLLEVGVNKTNVSIHELSCVPYLNFFSGSSPLISAASIKSAKSILKMKQFAKEIQGLEPDLVLFNTIVASVGSISINNTKCAFIDRETMVNPVHIRIYNRIISKNINGAAFLCNYEMKKFNLCDGIVSAVIPDCVSEEELKKTDESKRELPEDSYKVLFMGGSSWLKGADTALEAASKMSPNITLIVAGKFDESRFISSNIIKHFYNPSYFSHLIRLRKAYNNVRKRGNVIFVGAKANIYPLINECDVVIFPSSKVHQPRPCIEAGCFKKPVIISDYPETGEYFKDRYNALTFKPNSYKDLAEKINYGATHKNEMKTLGEHNFEMSVNLHNYNKTKEELIAFVEKLLSVNKG